MSANEQWQLSAIAAELYQRIPARYILGPWAPLLVERAAVAPGERVLDVACGTGVVTRAAAERAGSGGHVAGIDLNPGMIAVARSLPPAAGAAIEWHEASALALPFTASSFDVVLCQQGLQFFPDKALALREMRRVLRPGGRLALSVWNNTGLYNTAVGKALSTHVSQHVAVRFCASRKAPSGAELQRLVADAGFATIDLRIERMTIDLPPVETFALDHLSATPVASDIAAAAPVVREEIGRSVKDQLHAYVRDEGVSYPEETHVLTAQVQKPSR
jgi:ubiquinone/menaquinone biosynthesis C-methylase UbiE